MVNHHAEHADAGPAERSAEAPELLPSNPPAEWWLDRGLAERLYGLVERHDLSGDVFDRLLSDTVREFGSAAYAELIFLLTRLRLDPSDAVRHWPDVVARQEQISSQTGCVADIRVALLSYFLDVERQFERPKVVEMSWIEWTVASALLDQATGLPNQRLFRTEYRREIERALRESSPLSLIVLDLDDFKQINDTLGHQDGTAALAGFSRSLREHARGTDLVARYGGDEFVVLLPATTKAEAARVAEAMRAAASSVQCQLARGSETMALRFSAGVATCPGDGRDDAVLFSAADRAMYDAKQGGKNRVCLFGESTRSFSRRTAAWPAWLEPAGEEGFAVETIEIGEGGLSCRANRHVPEGRLVEAAFTLPNGTRFRAAGRVAWTRVDPALGREIAVRFIEAGGIGRRELSQWMFSA